MNIVQFLDDVGHTKLRFQYLHECVRGAKAIKGGVEIRFGTTESTVADVLKPQRIGIVVWMDRADYERAQEKINAS